MQRPAGRIPAPETASTEWHLPKEYSEHSLLQAAYIVELL